MEFIGEREFNLSSFDATIVIPAFNEDLVIDKTLQLLTDMDSLYYEVLIIVDQENDRTRNAVLNSKYYANNIHVLVQTYGPGPANAIRYGMANANADCVVVMMADGSDDARTIPELVNLVKRGVVVACASRYMSGGQQVGGQRFKKFLSKMAGRLLYSLAGVGTHDPTNSFKAYSRDFLLSTQIESRSGFEIGIELVAKARRRNLPIAEIPTIWLDRTQGESNFQITRWIPKYITWFLHSFGPTYKKETP